MYMIISPRPVHLAWYVLANRLASGRTLIDLHRQNQGQNQMLSEWAQECSDTYLREMYALHDPPDGMPCGCGEPSARFHCTDCLCNRPICQACLKERHRYMPT